MTAKFKVGDRIVVSDLDSLLFSDKGIVMSFTPYEGENYLYTLRLEATLKLVQLYERRLSLANKIKITVRRKEIVCQ